MAKRDLCEDCKFYDPFKEVKGSGYCRRNAPEDYGWPVIEATDWCGRWQANEAIVKAKLRAIEEANAMVGD